MIAKLPKRKKLPKKKPRIKKETSHKKKTSHKVLSFVGVAFCDLFFIMHEIIKLLHESILLETVTLVIYAI